MQLKSKYYKHQISGRFAAACSIWHVQRVIGGSTEVSARSVVLLKTAHWILIVCVWFLLSGI